MAKTPKTPQTSPIPAILTIALLASLAGNVALGMKAGETKIAGSMQPLSSIRPTLSSEMNLQTGNTSAEYDYGFGMRKNMQLTKDNCLLDECFLNVDLPLPVGSLPESYATGLAALAQAERDVASLIDATAAFRLLPAQKLQDSQKIRESILSFLEKKYNVSPRATESGVALDGAQGDAKMLCQQLVSRLQTLATAYDTELARTDIATHPDLDYAYRQLVTQTRNMHLPLVQNCSR